MKIIPFGKCVAKYELSSDIINQLKSKVGENAYDVSSKLIGRISKQTNYHLGDLGDYFKSFFKIYVDTMYKNKGPMSKLPNFEIELIGSWLNYQIEGDYNPFHAHNNCTMSSVLYLEVPETINKDKFPDGWLHFSDGEFATDRLKLEVGDYFVLPKTGDFYIFPSTLRHFVYPFKGEDTRKSIAMNAKHRII